MPNNDRLTKAINSKMDNLSNSLNGIFSDNYSADTTNRQELDRITDDIYNKIDNILSQNTNIQLTPNITQLYSRIQKNGNAGSSKNMEDLMSGLTDMMGNSNLNAMILNNPDLNRYVKIKDMQIDMILKYMPKLKTALTIKKDNVLSSDSFTKDFVFASNDSVSSREKEALFAQRNDEMKKKYAIEELFEKIYDDTSTYGEYFLYKVPYKKAFDRLMQNGNGKPLIESATLIEGGRVTDRDLIKTASPVKFDSNCNLTISFNQKGVLTETVKSYTKIRDIQSKYSEKSLYREFVEESAKSGKVFDDGLDYEKLANKANDGLVLQKEEQKRTKINDIPGCITKKLKRENVIPIYIEEVCLGYYYIEFNNNPDDVNRNQALLTNSIDDITKNDLGQENDTIVNYIASMVSRQIDEKFINANQDLKDEIYIMLKYNEQFNLSRSSNDINVTFLPPEDVYHFYFELDEVTHRGISDLDRSLVPAMFWCLLELTTTVGITTRAQDKRIYYVKQNVETNVARTLLNVINQLKKGNMGIRQMESMNNILGIVGKYNDHIIPMGQSGDAPIQFEVMQGQNIETPTELMNKFEEEAINSTDVPLELVNSSDQMDFAIRFTMANSKFLRKVFKRQAVIQRKYADIYSSIYNYEYNENESISIQLPAPAFLSMTNGVQLINNTREYVMALADIEYGNNGDLEEEKQEFIKLMIRHFLPTYIDVDLIDEYKARAKIEVQTSKSTIDTNAQDSGSDDDMM